tara:strand:- start:213 stop:581 length:369 start_codon:yes stop_codon:yes gene_type:complete
MYEGEEAAPYALLGTEENATTWPRVLLGVAVVLETGGTFALKLAATQHAGWHVLAYVLYALAFGVFPHVLRAIPLSIAYATWSGAGCVLTSVLGWTAFGEELALRQLVSIVAVIGGVMGLLL